MFGVSKKEHEQLKDKLKSSQNHVTQLIEKSDKQSKEYRELGDKHRELNHTLTVKFDEQKALAFKTMELEFQDKYLTKVQKIRSEYDDKTRDMMEKNFTHMKEELAKLHTEGNANTKYVEKASLKMMDVLAGGNRPKQLKGE